MVATSIRAVFVQPDAASTLDGNCRRARAAIVELVVARVVVDAPEVEIRYVIPLTGIA